MKCIFPQRVRTDEEQKSLEKLIIIRASQYAKTEQAPHNSPQKNYWYIIIDEYNRFVCKTDWEVFAIIKADEWHDKMDCQTFVIKVKKA